MAVFRVLGDQLVPESEYAVKAPELVRAMHGAGARSDSGPSIALESGQLFEFAAIAADPAGGGTTTGFTPIRFGSPVTIDIRHVYTGKVGSSGGFLGGGTGDIAVVSGVKEWSAFKASARALNWVATKKGKRTNLPRPSALKDGTPIIAYQKAIATKQLVVSVELASAPREESILDVLGEAFAAAAQIPLFLPYAGALLAAGQIVPATGKLLKAISGGNSSWDATEELNFGIAGLADADAGYRVIASANSGLEGLRFRPGAGLIDSDGQPYDGDQPYVVIAVDGAAQSELENFTAMVTSAEVMKRFHMGESGQNPIVDDLLDLMTIISDVKFREEALALKGKMTGMAEDETAKAQARYDALVKNIIKGELKP